MGDSILHCNADLLSHSIACESFTHTYAPKTNHICRCFVNGTVKWQSTRTLSPAAGAALDIRVQEDHRQHCCSDSNITETTSYSVQSRVGECRMYCQSWVCLGCSLGCITRGAALKGGGTLLRRVRQRPGALFELQGESSGGAEALYGGGDQPRFVRDSGLLRACCHTLAKAPH